MIIPIHKQRRLFAALAVTSIIFYFCYHIVSGNKGIIAMMQLRSKVEQASMYLDEVQMERLQLQHRVKMMSPESLDLDLLDEEVRKVLGYAGSDEIIYVIPAE